MNQLLRIGTYVTTSQGGDRYLIEEFLGGGGQGEVYRATHGDQNCAVKWYFSHQATEAQRRNLGDLVEQGPPSDSFLWPLDLVESPEARGFGYLMPLRPRSYQGLEALLAGRMRPLPGFRTLATASFRLADGFQRLHARGQCYRDISMANVFLDPANGSILICDNDNVTVNSRAFDVGVLGTPKFMAPEVVVGAAKTSTDTDLYSLAVLIFMMLVLAHPLDGAREAAIRCMDQPAMVELYGKNPVFVFDPEDDSNRPQAQFHPNTLDYWPLYPSFIRELFVKSFTVGLRSPESRVRETVWRRSLARLRDLVFRCECGEEYFYDEQRATTREGMGGCGSCSRPLAPTLSMRIEKTNTRLILDVGAELHRHHLVPGTSPDFRDPIARVVRHPHDPNLRGLMNLSPDKWTLTNSNGHVPVVPQRSARLTLGASINFGHAVGEINR